MATTQVSGKTVGSIGFGLMGFTWRPEPTPTDQAIEALKAGLEAGSTFWNGAEFYKSGDVNSMTLLNQYFAKYPEDADKVYLIIKGGGDIDTLKPDGSPEAIRRSIDNIIAQLGTQKKLDAFGIARRDHTTSFKETLEVIQKEYVDTGKIGGVAISECSAETVEEAAKYVKVAACEVEVSLFSTDVLHNGVAAACAKHGIPIAAYSPLSRGILSGQFKSASDTSHLGPLVTHMPRMQGSALEHNLGLTEKVRALADKKGCTVAQLAINWVRALSTRPGLPTFIPIPGATTVSRIQENTKFVDLTHEDLEQLQAMAEAWETSGGRYPEGVPTEL